MTQGLADHSTSDPVRAELLDALRGFALFGVLAANLIRFSGAFMADGVSSPASRAVEFGMDWLVHGKFYSIFSLLFGIGFALQIRRLEALGEGPSRYVRRLLILLLFGVLHLVLLYRGDILALYAVLGLVLLLCRGLPDRRLIWLAGLLWLAPVLWVLLQAGTGFQPQKPFSETGLAIYRAFAIDVSTGTPHFISGDPSYLHYLQNGVGGIFFRTANIVQELRPAKVLAMFLIGLWIGRRSLHERLEAHGPLLRATLLWGLAIGLPASAVMAWHIQNVPEAGGAFWSVREAAAYSLGVPTLALAYTAGFALLWRAGVFRKLLQWLAPAGRMALTNYLVQSMVQAALFAGWGLGWFGHLSMVWIPAVAVVIFVPLVLLSHLWLKAFRFGPFEWVWRSLTYGTPQPFMRPR